VRLDAVAAWWQERSAFRLHFAREAEGSWRVHASCTPRATILGHKVRVLAGETRPWRGAEQRLIGNEFVIEAERCPCIALSARTSPEVASFLGEQGYPCVQAAEEEAGRFALFLDAPDGLGRTRAEWIQARSELLGGLLTLDVPCISFGCWPSGHAAALAITGDIDSLTIQDFFLRVAEVAQAHGPAASMEQTSSKTRGQRMLSHWKRD
jgi:hypothetical protein